jgi:dihydroorotate dehydrogenase (fumarate)
MDLSTTYLGLKLPHPLMPGASPLSDDLDAVRRLEDAGAAAIVMHSLFEEQIVAEQLTSQLAMDLHSESTAEAPSYFPTSDQYVLGPDEYLEQLARVKAAVALPVIGSLNGTTPGGWLEYARLIEDAGADALELNVYAPAVDPRDDSAALERAALDLVAEVRRGVSIPIAVKLSPFYTAFAHFAEQLAGHGAGGLVLFNRFYQPDLDVERLEVSRTLRLSDSSELPLRLRWLAALSGRTAGSLACSGGVHTALDALKAVMCGAHAVQMVSCLLKHGPEQLGKVRFGLQAWLEEHEYESLAQAQGSMSLARCPDPRAYERANYIHVLQSWWGPASSGLGLSPNRERDSPL